MMTLTKITLINVHSSSLGRNSTDKLPCKVHRGKCLEQLLRCDFHIYVPEKIYLF